jgi:ADP-heptose:LPS heptosyltransferase
MIGLLKPPPRRIVVLRALKLGDMLCAVPSFRALRWGFPLAHIALVGLPWAREFAERFAHYIDAFHEFPGYRGLPEREPVAGQVEPFFRRMKKEGFDAAIQLHGSGSISNEVTARIGARVNAGFYEPGRPCPDPTTFLPYPSQGLELRRLLGLVKHLGIPVKGESLEFPVSMKEQADAQRIGAEVGLEPYRYVCIHAGASVAERRWPIDQFAIVADAVADRGCTVVLTGSAGEADLTRAIAAAMRSPAIDLAGKTQIGTLAALLEQARLLVCNDTGVSHIADALGVPSVVISTGDNPERWSPADSTLHRILRGDQGLTPAEVLAQADELLRAERTAALRRENALYPAGL